MKHITSIFVALVLVSGAASAQTMTTDTAATPVPRMKHTKPMSFKSINGHEVLPQQGEFALGVSATGFLNYFGNMMNNTGGNTAPTFNSANTPDAFAVGRLSGIAIMGKYMKTNDLAYRVRFQANAGSATYRNNVLQSSLTPDPLNPVFVEDKLTDNTYTVLLGAGFEKRRGSGRLQGFYGAEALAGFAGETKDYAYGNAIDINFNTPLSTTNFANASSANQAVRTTKDNSGTMFLFGVRSFVGVEYFIAPKVSIGGEIGYTLGFSTNGKRTLTNEAWNSALFQTTTVTTEKFANEGLRSWGIGLDNVNAGLNLHFYF